MEFDLQEIFGLASEKRRDLVASGMSLGDAAAAVNADLAPLGVTFADLVERIQQEGKQRDV